MTLNLANNDTKVKNKNENEIINRNQKVVNSIIGQFDILVVSEIWAKEALRLMKEEKLSERYAMYLPLALRNKEDSNQLTVLILVEKTINNLLKFTPDSAEILLEHKIYNKNYKRYCPFAINRNVKLTSNNARLIGVYLPPTNSDWPERNSVRQKMLKDLFNDMREHLSSPQGFILYAGDFNFYPANTKGFEEIESIFLNLPPKTNAWNFVKPSLAQGSWNGKKLDYIFTNQNIVDLKLKKIGHDIDHDSLLATIEINI